MAGGEARANDMEYCAELTAMYRKYLGQTSSRQSMPDVTASTAIDACESGNTAAGIPVLEKQLTNALHLAEAQLISAASPAATG